MTDEEQRVAAMEMAQDIYRAARPVLDSHMEEMIRILHMGLGDKPNTLDADARAEDETIARLILATLVGSMLLPNYTDEESMLCHMSEIVRLFTGAVIKFHYRGQNPSRGDVTMLLEHTLEHVERDTIGDINITDVLSKLFKTH